MKSESERPSLIPWVVVRLQIWRINFSSYNQFYGFPELLPQFRERETLITAVGWLEWFWKAKMARNWFWLVHFFTSLKFKTQKASLSLVQYLELLGLETSIRYFSAWTIRHEVTWLTSMTFQKESEIHTEYITITNNKPYTPKWLPCAARHWHNNHDLPKECLWNSVPIVTRIRILT